MEIIKGMVFAESQFVMNGIRLTLMLVSMRSRKWALSHGYRDDLTIDRIDYNKGYSPDNCRWVDMDVQNNNSSHNHLITYNNKTQSLSLWCKEFSLPYDTIKRRINCFGWSAEKAFNTPIRVLHKRST